MNNLGFGIEVLIVGFLVVIAALFLLALILILFSKVLASRRKGGKQIVTETAKNQSLSSQIKEIENRVIIEDEQAAAKVHQETIGQQTVALEPPGNVQPEIAAAIAGVFQSMDATVNPEIVAAATGALLYASESPGLSLDEKITRTQPSKRLWKEAGRTKIVHLRHDFVLLRRGKFR